MQMILNVQESELHYVLDRCCELGLSLEDYFHILIYTDRKENKGTKEDEE